MTRHLIDSLLASYGYYAIFALVALESLGVPLPGESAVIAAALYAGTTHHLNVTVLAAVAIAAAILGDNAGYWLGRTAGQRLADRYGRLVRLDRDKLRVGRYLFAEYGGKVVFFGRFVAVLRTYAAFLAGVSRMSWSRFLIANAAGGALWAALYTYGAYLLGSRASRVGTTITIVGSALAVVLALTAILVVRRSFDRLQQRANRLFPDDATPRADPRSVRSRVPRRS